MDWLFRSYAMAHHSYRYIYYSSEQCDLTCKIECTRRWVNEIIFDYITYMLVFSTKVICPSCRCWLHELKKNSAIFIALLQFHTSLWPKRRFSLRPNITAYSWIFVDFLPNYPNDNKEVEDFSTNRRLNQTWFAVLIIRSI